MANLIELTKNENGIFIATFDQDIGVLPAGTAVSLPAGVGEFNNNDCSSDSDTIATCINIVHDHLNYVIEKHLESVQLQGFAAVQERLVYGDCN